jgi:peptidoglycan/xylan/chitin deacetylase (PgdA/CDA1 family)
MRRMALVKIFDALLGRRRTIGARNTVLLTFDDGPDPHVTPEVLDRLKEYDARAIFFVVGSRINRAPHLLERIRGEGHLIGNHTYAHRLDKDPGLALYLRDVRHCQTLIEELTGDAPRFFRAPMGRRSLGALLSPSLLGLRHVLWSFDSDDWTLRDEKSAVRCAQRLCSSVTQGDIVLFHDDNPWVLILLDRLLPHLKTRGIDLHSAIGQL